jgi:hypothetical protein
MVLIFQSAIPLLFAFPRQVEIEKTFQLASSKKENTTLPDPPEEKIEIPDWVKRTNFAVELGTDMKPKYFLETIQPLFGTQNKETVLFNQTRISGSSNRTTYNLGFGARKIYSESYLLGFNAFYDFQDLHQHHRAGFGLEAITDRGLEGRMNGYFRVSSKRLVRDDGINEYFEKVANGLDWEFGGPLPYLSFLKLYGGGNWYNFEHFANKCGWQMRMEYNPIKYSRLTFIMLDDNKRNDISYRFEGALTLAFTSFALGDILKDIKTAREAFPKIDVRDKVLDRVVRDFDITVISSTKSKSTGLTVEGGRK